MHTRAQNACLGALILWSASPVTAAVPETHIVDLIRAAEATGIHILYSSELVPADLSAPEHLDGTEPVPRLTAALAAHELLLLKTGPGRYVVTRAAVTTARRSDSALLQPETLDEVAVYGSRYAFSSSGPNPATQLDQRKMAEVPGAATDAVRATNSVPGVTGNLSAKPYIRGANPDDVLVTFDGIALADPFHFNGFQNLISAFDPSAVDQIIVSTGGFPVRYGTRSAGVLELTPRTLTPGSEYGLGASLLGYTLESVGEAQILPVEWLVTARHSTDHSVLQPIMGDDGEPTFSDLVSRLRWHTGENSALTAGTLVVSDHLYLRAPTGDENARGDTRDLTSWMSWDWSPTSSLQTHTSLAVATSELRNNGTLALPGIVDTSLDESRDFRSTTLQHSWVYQPAANITWNAGVDFMRESAGLSIDLDKDFTPAGALAFNTALDASSNTQESPVFSTLDAYVSARRRWQNVDAEFGGRIDAQHYQGFGSHAQFSPRFNLRYDLSRSWHWYGSLGDFTQAQRVDEYRLETNQTRPDAASRSTHFTTGVSHETASATEWRIEAYDNYSSTVSPYFDNKIGIVSLIPQLEPDRLLISPSSSNAAGIELSAHHSFGNGFGARGSYTLSRVTDTIDGQSVPRSWDQTHAADLDLAWAGKRAGASLQIGWHSGWPKTPLTVIPGTTTSDGYLDLGNRNSARWGDYFDLGLRLSTLIPLPFGDLSLWLDGTNITNRTNECCFDLNTTSAQEHAPNAIVRGWSPDIINVGFTLRVRAR